jgi:hypothetical protein
LLEVLRHWAERLMNALAFGGELIINHHTCLGGQHARKRLARGRSATIGSQCRERSGQCGRCSGGRGGSANGGGGYQMWSQGKWVGANTIEVVEKKR